MAAKLAVNMHKPNQQTTILKEAILPVMLDLPVNKITGIGRVLVKRLNVELGIFFVKDALHEKFSMSKLCALFGSRVGRFLFLAFRGIDEAEVKDQVAPKVLQSKILCSAFRRKRKFICTLRLCVKTYTHAW